MTQQAPPPLRNSAAGRLRQLMEAAGLSTMDLAQQLGCSRSTAYRRLRTGPRSIEEVILLAGLLNVKPYQVLRGTAQSSENEPMTPTDIYRDGALDTMRRLVNHLTLATDLDEWRPLFMASLEAFETGEAPAPPELADTDWQMVPLPFAPDHGDGTVVIQHSSSETIGTVSSGWAPEADGETDEEPLAVTQTEHGWEGTLDDTPRHSEDPSPAEELAQTAATVEIPDAEPAGQLAFGGLPLSQAIERVLTASVDACGTSVAGLRGKGQARPEVNARTVAAVLLCELLSLDTATISKHVNRSEPSVANYLLWKSSGTRDEVAALLEEARTAVLSA